MSRLMQYKYEYQPLQPIRISPSNKTNKNTQQPTPPPPPMMKAMLQPHTPQPLADIAATAQSEKDSGLWGPFLGWYWRSAIWLGDSRV